MPSASVIIVAAGVGARMNDTIPKQFMQINSKPILSHTINRFNYSKEVVEIILVVAPQYLDSTLLKTALPENLSVPLKIIEGGEKRQDSVYNGLLAVDPKSSIVAVHDGVRPFVSQKCIKESILSCNHNPGAVVAIRTTDTLKNVKNEIIINTVDRTNIFQVQTPQTFQKNVLLESFKKAQQDNFTGTDEASLVERLGYRIKIIPGSRNNIKITTKDDLLIAETLIKNKQYDEN